MEIIKAETPSKSRIFMAFSLATNFADMPHILLLIFARSLRVIHKFWRRAGKNYSYRVYAHPEGELQIRLRAEHRGLHEKESGLMDYLVICTVAMLVASVTLFSGFGLGTVLMPAFAFFFPVPVAIAATAVVHLANNVFKLILVGRHANWGVVLRFALPAAAAAIAGAGLLTSFAAMAPLITYELTGRPHEITTVKAAIGLLIILFAALKFLPAFAQLRFPLRYMAIGGLVSGFFGGLSGNQGAFRSAFLVQAGLSRDAFVGTGVVSAVVVDIARLSVYGAAYYSTRFTAMDEQITGVVGAAILAAFLGSFLGTRLLHKITLALIQKLVAATMILVGVGLVSGLL